MVRRRAGFHADMLVIFDDHHPGTSMPSGGHPPHQLAASSFSETVNL
jgi:hypothetical protein